MQEKNEADGQGVDMDSHDKEKKARLSNDIAVAAGNIDTVSRYGSANGEHIVAYTGIDNETGQTFSRSLEGIANSKVNPNYEQSNIKQQAGFSAEVKSVARKNAENHIKGENRRTVRTDDISKQPDGKGNTIGGTNDQLYDLAEVDQNGIYVEGTASQLKFVGGDAKQCAQKLLNSKYDKYRDADVKIEIPSDFFEDVQKIYKNKIDEIDKGIRNAEEKGDHARADKLRQKRDRVLKTKNNLKKSEVSNKDAIFARLHPRLSTAADMLKISHRAGLKSAQYGAIIGGTISATRNIIAMMQGDKELQDALYDTTLDTGRSTVLGYGTGFAGSLIKAGMQKSASKTLQQFSRTSLPALVVTVTLELGTSINRYAKGEIDSVQFLEELGEKGAGLLAGGMMATIGQFAIPIPVVGGVIGSMVGYTISSLFYHSSLQALQGAKEAERHYQIVKAECEEARRAMRQYQAELQALFEIHMTEVKTQLYACFAGMDNAITSHNVDAFAVAANDLGGFFGKTLQFKTMQEFDDFMASEGTLIL